MSKSNIRKQYDEMFEQCVEFHEIQQRFGVKANTVFNHFFEYLYEFEYDEGYRNFIKRELPKDEECRKIEKLTYQNRSFGYIKHRINENVEYRHIKLIQCLSRLDMLEKYIGESFTTQMFDNSETVIDGCELFDFLSPNDQSRFKMAIGQYLSHKAIKWQQGEDIIEPKVLNNLDRVALAKQFLKDDGYKRLSYYEQRYEREDDKLVLDTAVQIDFKIPKNYQLKRNDIKNGYKDHTIEVKNYKGILTIPELRYYYIENYIRDELALERDKHSYIGYEEHVLPYVKELLLENGLKFIDGADINLMECKRIVYFLLHDEDNGVLNDVIQYEG